MKCRTNPVILLSLCCTLVIAASSASAANLSVGRPVTGDGSGLSYLTDSLDPVTGYNGQSDNFSRMWYAGENQGTKKTFEVDLQQSYALNYIQIWGNYAPSVYYSIPEFSIDVSTDHLNYTPIIDHNQTLLQYNGFTFNLPGGPAARYVRFTVENNYADVYAPPGGWSGGRPPGGASLTEFEVFGTAVPEPHFGALCGLMVVVRILFLRNRKLSAA